MVIIIRASMKAKEGKRDDALAAIRATMKGSISEPGCIEYRFTSDIDDPDIFHVLEIWEDEPSLFAHFGGDAFKGFMAKAGDVVDPMGFHALKGDLDAYALPI